MHEKKSCVDCGAVQCSRHNSAYPDFCLTTALSEEELDAVVELYLHDEGIRRAAVASAEVEGKFYGAMTRVEEVLEFARRIGAKKIGVATCAGLIDESRIFARIARLQGFEVFGVACKAGDVAKASIGIGEEYIREQGESICNPILQAKLLNKQQTDLNVLIGLCVGHDSLFCKFSDALATTLVVKDRVLGHNPVAALYQTRSYYRRLLQEHPAGQKEGQQDG